MRASNVKDELKLELENMFTEWRPGGVIQISQIYLQKPVDSEFWRRNLPNGGREHQYRMTAMNFEE